MTKQELKEQLKIIRSKEETEAWANDVSNNETLFLKLWEIVKEEAHPSAWRAFWVMDKTTTKDHALIMTILEELYELMMNTANEAYIRHGMKMIFRCPIDEDLALPLLDQSLLWLNNQHAKMSTRGCSLLLFFEIYKIYPDLKPELVGILEDQREKQPSPGVLSIIKRIEKALKM